MKLFGRWFGHFRYGWIKIEGKSGILLHPFHGRSGEGAGELGVSISVKGEDRSGSNDPFRSISRILVGAPTIRSEHGNVLDLRHERAAIMMGHEDVRRGDSHDIGNPDRT